MTSVWVSSFYRLDTDSNFSIESGVASDDQASSPGLNRDPRNFWDGVVPIAGVWVQWGFLRLYTHADSKFTFKPSDDQLRSGSADPPA